MSSPEAWLKATVETAAGALAWPVAVSESAALPFVVYSRESTERPLQTSGLTGFADGEFSLEVCGASWTSARTVADAIVAAVQNFTGTANGAIIDHVHVAADRDVPAVYLTDGQDFPSYFVIELKIFIRWRE
jgi:hypothetical protein